jgi:hypothetical protein
MPDGMPDGVPDGMPDGMPDGVPRRLATRDPGALRGVHLRGRTDWWASRLVGPLTAPLANAAPAAPRGPWLVGSER